jgi:hypothetical protein
MIDFTNDLGKFVNISYETQEGVLRFARGLLKEIDEDGHLVIIHIKKPNIIKRINPTKITIVDYTAEPVEEDHGQCN